MSVWMEGAGNCLHFTFGKCFSWILLRKGDILEMLTHSVLTFHLMSSLFLFLNGIFHPQIAFFKGTVNKYFNWCHQKCNFWGSSPKQTLNLIIFFLTIAKSLLHEQVWEVSACGDLWIITSKDHYKAMTLLFKNCSEKDSRTIPCFLPIQPHQTPSHLRYVTQFCQ